MKNTKFQKKLDKTPNPEYGDLNEYDLSFIPTPQHGPYKVDDGLLQPLDLEFFSKDFIDSSIAKFQKRIIKKIGAYKYSSIEECLAAYTASATNKNEKLFMLKKSVLEFDDVFINSLGKDDKLLYLEKHRKELLEFDLVNDGFTTDDLIIYKQEAIQINKKCLKKYVEYLKKKHTINHLFNSFEDIIIFRGFDNRQYYKKNNKKSDFLSLYAACDNETYYEPNILNSYSIAHYLSEKFMVANGSQRRAFVTTSYGSIMNNLLSSFLNSSAFVENQFEILTIPSSTPLTITQVMNNPELYTSFRID